MMGDLTKSGGAMPSARATHEPSPDGLGHAVSVPIAIAEQVLSMGKVEWGATAAHTDAGHLEHLAESLRLTREYFNLEDIPVPMHGLYLEGTETVLCHTGTSPNSGANARALVGAWNWLVDQCAAQGIEARQGRDGNRLDPKDESPVGSADAPKGASHD